MLGVALVAGACTRCKIATSDHSLRLARFDRAGRIVATA
jgi:hypothetical protein